MDSELLLRFRGLLSVRDPRLGIRLYSDIYIRSRISQLRLSLNGPLCAGRSQSRSLTSPAHTTLTNCYQWRIAAAYSAKNRVFKPKQNLYSFRHPGCTPFLPGQSQLSVDSAVKRPDSGQDSFFVSSIGRSRLVAFGVADGVGGWVQSGIDSADFAHGLCYQLARTAFGLSANESEKVSPESLLEAAYAHLVHEPSIPGGGSTACIAIAGDNGNLGLTNLGDSGFLHLKPNKVQYQSRPQTHAFNTPYQLSLIPPYMLAQARLFGGQPLNDLPRDAESTRHPLEHGDVAILATDGLWDNLSTKKVLKIVRRCMAARSVWIRDSEDNVAIGEQIFAATQPGESQDGKQSLQDFIASTLVAEAKTASICETTDGPFAKEMQRVYPADRYRGGKIDDICVVVAIPVRDTGKTQS